MHPLHFTAETSSNGVVERDFTVGEVAGVLWSSASGSGRAPLVLMGHGGGMHKKAPAMVGRAHRFVTNCGFTVATIDAPGHGDRPRTADDEREIAAMQQAMAAGEPVGPIVVRHNADLAERAVPEWRATQITVPVEFMLQWDDEHIPRRSGLALFDAFASREKTLHANAGRHKELPKVRVRQRRPVPRPASRPGRRSTGLT